MLKSYLKSMLRNIARHSSYSAITVSGLTVGITFALLIGVFIRGELQVNKGLKDVERLFLLEVDNQDANSNLPSFFVPARLAPAATETYPNLFERCYRFYDRGITISKDDRNLRIQSMIGDSTLLEMFGFKVLHGDPRTALNASNSIVITETIAQQFFSRIDVPGESLTISTESGGRQEFRITAVIADLQEKNSVTDFMNMDAQVFLSLEAARNFNVPVADDWNASIITYMKLAPATTFEKAQSVLNELFKSDAPEAISENRTVNLRPLADYYLLTNHGAVRKLIISLTVIVIFILVLAITNFVNISIARSFSRLREVGVRKAIGGIRVQVIIQFLSESLSFATFSGGLSLMFYETLRGYFGSILDTTLPSLTELDAGFWLCAAGGIVLTGLLAGTYPAVYLSSTRTIESLKGKFRSVKATIRFSRGLIALQFLIAIFIFTVSIIFSKQISWFMEADLGYNHSRVLVVSSVPRIWNEEGMNRMEAARTAFLSSPAIRSASLSWGAPNFNFSPLSARVYRAGTPVSEGVLTTMSAADEAYDEVYDLTLTDGEFLFEDDHLRRPGQVVLNESAQKALSVQVGDKVSVEGSPDELTVAGIVRDFHYESMHQDIKPVALLHPRDFRSFRYFSFRLEDGSLNNAVQEVERIWKKVFPDDPFVYEFADARLASVYKTELQLEKAAVIGSALILIIVLTGVLGLVSLSVSKRNKEIGVRKVMGASTGDIIVLIAREYAVMMIIAFAVGIPLSYLFIADWMGNFAYRMTLSWWVFAAPVGFLFCLTILVVTAQSLRTATSNPVKALRYE